MSRHIKGLTKENSYRILKGLGFHKRKGLDHDYVKYLRKDLRVHVKLQLGGFYWHIDDH